MVIKILGQGCKNCLRLQQEVEVVLTELAVHANMEKVTEVKDIISYGIMRTPGLIINEKLKSFGRIPNKEELRQFIQEELV